jgi:uridine kinase
MTGGGCRFIGIAGGSGAGKSTLAYHILDAHPLETAIVHGDDHFKPPADVPFFEGIQNWSDPAAHDFDGLHRNLLALRAGEPIEVRTKSERFNPEYESVGKIKLRIDPRPVVVVEGTYALFDARIRDLLEAKIFLDTPHPVRMERRRFKEMDPDITWLMYQQHILPTRIYADLTVETEGRSADQVYEAVRQLVDPVFAAL